MEGSKLIILAARAFQILFAAVVLGVSVSLATQFNKLQKDCNAETKDSECKLFGMIPAIEYSAFVGAFGLLDALIGLAGCFLEMIPYLVTVGFDALADIFYIAGGVRLAVLLADRDFEILCKQNSFSGYCTRIKADSAFEFLGFIITLVLVGMGFMWQRRGAKMHSAV